MDLLSAVLSKMEPQNEEISRVLETEKNPETITIKEFLKEVVKFTLLALVVVVPIRVFIAQPFIVNGSSMDPTFHDGQYLIVDELTYALREPQRGDVVIFKYPNDPSKYFIKRLIGLPGETVMIRDGVVSIQDARGTITTLSEPYIAFPKTESSKNKLVKDEYFVMGDNRAGSFDSRGWGPIHRSHLTGRALLRLLPLNTIATLPGATKYDRTSRITN